MNFHSHPSQMFRSAGRKPAMAGLLGATMLLAPLAASAQPAGHHHHAAHKTAEQRAESLDERIASLHTRLQITPAEETDWNAVAQVMRDNEARMQGMIAARKAEPAHHVDALEDLRNYERFTQAHVDGLKLLRSSFETLYMTMPDSQKLVVDDVVRKFSHRHEAHA
jgi:hypothetical protein